ncbi:MAG: NAD(P)H-dependent oxidoreductase [bacterium]
MEGIRTRVHKIPRPLRLAVGIFCIIAGIVSIVTPLTSWGFLFFVGLELIGVRLLFVEKGKAHARHWYQCVKIAFIKYIHQMNQSTFLSNLHWRYATKQFDGSKLSDKQLETILDAVRLAPTSYGLQPFHVTVVSDSALREQLKKAAWDQPQLTSSSHVLVFSARTDLKDRIEAHLMNTAGGNLDIRAKLAGFEGALKGFAEGKTEADIQIWATKQVYIALGFALAACAEMQIDSCPMEGFDPAQFKKILSLPAHLYPCVVLAVGKRASTEVLKPKVRFGNADLFDAR